MTTTQWRRRKNFLKKQLIQLMGGLPERRTPLNAETIEVVEEGNIICEKVYGSFGRPERVKLVLYDGGHAFTEEMQQEAYRWFDRWLLGKKPN